MAEIFGYPIMGGGGSDLNFKVIAVVSESALPSTAAENTIAVITTSPITSYVFSSTAPTSPAEGMVWFATGTASTVEFNAIKRNGLWVYPTGCQQYVSGAWASKTAKTYQNGAWVDWMKYIYSAGSASTGYSFSSGMGGLQNGNLGSAQEYPNSWYMQVEGSNCGISLYTNEKIDLTNYSTFTTRGRKMVDNVNWTKMAVSTGNGSAFYPGIVSASDIGYSASNLDWSLDISSLAGAYYLGWFMVTTGTIDATSLAIIQVFLGMG